ncbi:MAG: zinc-binding dehydrogenase, partial [Halobacteriales archaeon]|nr:zinc-binding dehydrogenase [Halobacteriales archaeon]
VTPGSAFSGTVRGVGDNVTEFQEGDRVLGHGINKYTPWPGAFADYSVAPTDRVAKLPSDVPFDVGAAIGHVGLTAWLGMIEYGDTRPGDTVLIHGGSGGVGHIAVQLAKIAGASRIIATAGSDERRAAVRRLGATDVLDYHDDDLKESIMDVGRPDGILDHRIADYLELDIEVANWKADIVGIMGHEAGFTNALEARRKNVAFHQVGATGHSNIGRRLTKLATLLSYDQLTVEIAATFDLADADQAHRMVQEESFVGKVIVTP